MSAFHCSACGTPINRKWGYCPNDERLWRAQTVRPCVDCRAEMPKGRQNRRCTDCLRKYVHRLADRPNRRCQCGSRIKRGYTHGCCPDCRSMETQEGKARKRARPS